MRLFKDKYRILSTRLPGWDFAQSAYYYVTICTKNRTHLFGDVKHDVMTMSPIGEIIADEWKKTEVIRPNVKLDEWIIMPNHMHAILIITYKIESSKPTETPQRMNRKKMPQRMNPKETPQRGVSTNDASAKWAANSLGSIIGQFKGKCTKRIWAQNHTEFAWQSRFYDRIIRTENELHNARLYITSNPQNWDKDRHNDPGLYI